MALFLAKFKLNMFIISFAFSGSLSSRRYSGKSIFEILGEHIKEARTKYGVDIPWYLMTSDENNDDTVNLLSKLSNGGFSG